MTAAHAAQGMLRAEGLRLVRDRFLLSITLYIIGLTLLMRWLIPWMSAELDVRLGFDFQPYVPLLVSHLLIQMAGQLGGIVLGMLLLESREDRTIKALLVTPVPLGRYLAGLGLVTMAGTFLLALAEGAVIGIGLPPWPQFALAALLGTPAAMIMGLLVAALADDKLQAFAYLKLIGLLPALASAAWFVSEPWQWLFVLYPPYSASKVYWLAESGAGGLTPYVLAGLLGSALWLVVLGKLFIRAARQG